ncbi:MAG TPA: transcription antitermination factor NusB [Patescibacteria group bacterium]|nr:transcription antitermination factor NusB [Patescibacteria group bacterium]
MTLRHKGRECALQMLYQWELSGAAPARVQATFWRTTRGSHETRLFANKLFEGAVAGAGEIDQLIALHALNWRLERMAAIDRNILRLAVHELLCGENPVKVVINEALDLTKKFSEPDAVPFINGVLDEIRKSTETPKPA